jgi:lysozyme
MPLLNEKLAVEKAASIVRESEGLRLVPYLCPAGKLTVGYGHRTDSKKVISLQQAEAWLMNDLTIAARAIGDDVLVKCNTNQMSALLSLVLNVGGHAFSTSRMRARILQSEMPAASAEFVGWDKATVNGARVTLPGLTIRREAERTLFDCLADL